jgi:hypothetical protein
MKKLMATMAVASMAVIGCGSDGDSGGSGAQEELADLLVTEETGFDEECVREKTDELSDADAQFLVDNIDATDTEGFSQELQDWVLELFDCVTENLVDE